MPDWDSLRAELEPIVDAYIDAHPDLVNAYGTGGESLFTPASAVAPEDVTAETSDETADISELEKELKELEASLKEAKGFIDGIESEFNESLGAAEPRILAEVSNTIAHEAGDQLGLAGQVGELGEKDFDDDDKKIKALVDKALDNQDAAALTNVNSREDLDIEFVPVNPSDV